MDVNLLESGLKMDFLHMEIGQIKALIVNWKVIGQSVCNSKRPICYCNRFVLERRIFKDNGCSTKTNLKAEKKKKNKYLRFFSLNRQLTLE